jgi:D-alanyl-D-alanine carboxypeptidase (penicillin-binding protein 5/6)
VFTALSWLFFSLIFSPLEASEVPLPAPTLTAYQIDYHPSVPRVPDLSFAPVPLPSDTSRLPLPKATSAILVDLGTGTVLYEKDADTRRPIASITKVMTAIVALESYTLDQKVTLSKDVISIEGNKVYFYGGEVLTVLNLIKGALIASGNDAAFALSLPLGFENFVAAMNQKAESLFLTNTHFQNPMGFDHSQNYSSARDLVTLSRYALRKGVFRDIVSTREATFVSDQGFSHRVTTTNDLLGSSFLNVKGLKTGTTPKAGECLIALATNEQGRELLVVILGSTDRYSDAKQLLHWGFTAWEWK